MAERITSMICDILRDLHERGVFTAHDMGDLLGIHATNCYPYHSHREPKATKLRLVFRAMPAEAQRDVLHWLTGGTGWVSQHLDQELDINGDGDVDVSDAMIAAAELTGETSEFIADLALGLSDKKIDDAECGKLQAMLAEARQHLVMTEAVVVELNKQHNARRKCRQPLTAGGRAKR